MQRATGPNRRPIPRAPYETNFAGGLRSGFRIVHASAISCERGAFFRRSISPGAARSTSRILVADSPTGKGRLIVGDVEVLLSSATAPWQDVVLEWQRLPPNEVPKLFPKQHTILVYLNRKPIRMERLSNGRLRRLDSVAGDICIGPADSMTGLSWRDPLEALAISPSHGLVARNAAEWYDPARVELIRHDRVRDPLIEQIGLALKTELAEGCPFGSLYGDTLASALTVHLLRRYSAQQPNRPEHKGGLGGRRLKLTVDYIEANLSRNLRLDELAENVGLSPSYFCTAFVHSTGMPPHQWMLQRRIEQAKGMLVSEGAETVEIASALGFADQSHFCRFFRRFVGATPATFARELAH